MPRCVVFDLGGVLIDWDPRYLYRKLLSDEAEIERFLATVCTPEWNALQDGGRPIAEATRSLVAEWPEHASLIQAYYTRWTEMIAGQINETVDVLRELKRRGTPLYALTNWSAETFPLVEHQYQFMGWFKGILVSGREHLKKPDPRIFRLLLRRYGLTASNTLFIDDNADNVRSALSLGIVALRFTSARNLRSSLIRLGVL